MNIDAANHALLQQAAQAQTASQPQPAARPDNDGDQDDGVQRSPRPQGSLGHNIDVEA
ncbi:hypothetical protein KGQ90_10265 [Modicisalibacter tunisiensis]|uniref:hypothetical protein n=1 Tax=Modicisalibacter tunisiensis TaxID=390637 RepID=UPI00079AA354|nr:hypothetical protein [Modicisalibacter tunisiensis]KXS39850.1 MAG: hypothetical protein AWU55_225 [Halomonadaceae bacterium T82-2]MBZ9539319.1 hypothetical protein [Modicisalibacter tunisiensis]